MRQPEQPSRSPFTPDQFHPPWWLRSAHAQTISGTFIRPDYGINFQRERIETPDGDFLDLDFVTNTPHNDSGATLNNASGTASAAPSGAPANAVSAATAGTVPAVLVLHGLEGSTSRQYMQATYRELLRRGMRPIGLNFRSCSGEPNRLPRFYHSGETGDLRFILEYLAGRFAGGLSGVIGFSLGGNMLLKFLGEEGEAAREWVGAAAVVSVPFDLAAGAAALERGPMARIYTEYFLRSLRRKVRAKEKVLRPLVDLDAALRARTLRRFDDLVTAPLHGFTDAADYYHRSSSTHYLAGIHVPTLILHAEDDPFLPAAAIPRDAVVRNPHLLPAFSRYGGHVGFVTGTPWAPRFHAEAEAARFLAGARAGGV